MKRVIIIFLLLCVLQVGLFALDNVFTTQLNKKLETLTSNEFVKINIRLKEQYNTEKLRIASQNLPKSQKREFVINKLKNFSQISQHNIMEVLRNGKNNGEVKSITPLWITNVITCYVKKSFIHNLIDINDIDRVDYDEMRKMLIEAKHDDTSFNRNREITWNVSHVDADDVWGLGYTGTGVLVAVLDTGLNYNHHDIVNQLWDGGSAYPHHGYDFVNDDNDPWDEGGNANGHGTHCAGTVAGDGTSGSQTGVAPDASIMALKILSGDGSGTESGVWNAIQFCVDHNVDVMSMSVGWQHSWGVDRQSWRNSMVNALSAGVVAAVAAGNEGDDQGTYPIPDNVRTPGDCPPPWLNPDQTLTGGLSCVVTVGASDSSDNLSYFSSLGPVTWENVSGYNDYAHNPEMGLIRPDVTAPGSNIKSLDYQNVSGYLDGWSGTSMATPCVAGVMALMLSKNHDLTPAQVDQIIEETVTNATNPKNNHFGSGIINALNAVNAVSLSQFPAPTNLTATVNGSSVSLSWNAPTRALSSYNIYRDNAVVGTTTSTSYTDSGLSEGVTYSYHVTAVYTSPNGESGYSNNATASIPVALPYSTDFSNSNGWIQQNENCTDRWTSSSTNSAGGSSPEMRASWENVNPGTTRFVTPALNTQNSSELNLTFKHFYDYYADSDITIKLQSSSDGVSWTDEVWNYPNPTGNMGPETVSTNIYNNIGDITYIAWVITGNLYNFDYWYLDDVSITSPSVPLISVSPTNIAYGDVFIGEPATHQFTIQNTGLVTLTGDIITINGYHIAESTRSETLHFSINSNNSKTYNLQLDPQTTGTYNGNITINSNASNFPQTHVAVTGNAVYHAIISVNRDSLNFGNVLLGEYTSETFTIDNNGDETLSGSITPPADYYVYEDTTVFAKTILSNNRASLDFSITAHQNKHYIVYFYPMTTGVKSGTITFSSNDPYHTAPKINVVGTGYLNPPTNVTVTINGDDIVINWDYNNKVTTYHVYGCDTPDGNFIELGTIPQSPFTILNGANDGLKFYKVTAE